MKQSYSPPSFSNSERLASIRKVIPEIDLKYKEFAEKHHVPGYAYGIMLDGQLIHSESGGFIDLEHKIPATPHSMFRVASMTKSFVSMAILLLRDAGKLRLDDPLYLCIPEIQNQQLTKDAPVITVRDLLVHTAGFPTDDPWADRKMGETDEQLLNLLKGGIFFSTTAGTTFEYSNLGYTLLGFIIEKITGISYGQFIAEKIWKPLGMEAEWDFKDVPAFQLAHGYRWEEERWKEEEMDPHGTFGAMGGMIASVESFSRYVAIHQSAWPPRDEVEAGPLKRSSIREMHQPHIFSDLMPDFKYSEGTPCCVTRAYGYGVRWHRDSHQRVFVGHSGGLPGFGSNWYIMPEYGLGVISFANATYAPAVKINLDVLDALVNAAQLEPRSLSASTLLKERYQALVKLFPNWDSPIPEIFAANFFLDYPLEILRKNTQQLFAKTDSILSVGDIIPENQLRGYFKLVGKKGDLEIKFSLSPENPPLIQEFQVKELEKKI